MEHELNFIEIVINGYINHRKYLPTYYLRQLKQAQTNHHYNPDEFLSRCADVCNQLEKNITDQVRERRFELYDMLAAAEEGIITFKGNSGLTHEQKMEETKTYCLEELKPSSQPDTVGSATYNVQLTYFTNHRFRGILYYEDIIKVSRALLETIELFKAEIAQSEVKSSHEQVQPIQTKAGWLREQLAGYGFFDMPELVAISEEGITSLIEKMSRKQSLPYSIALFDQIGFIKHLREKFCKSEGMLHKIIAAWFSKDITGRSVKGNLSSLVLNSSERKRYTAYQHKEIVLIDIQALKKGVPLN